MLDPIQQRIVGVLFEKELTVPDSYPLTESALLSGCNQKSNRNPAMTLDAMEIHPELLALREDGWIARVESGGRAVRYRHRLLERLNVDKDEMIVLTELLLRGPQSPGALKPRVARMGFRAEPEQIRQVLEKLAGHQPMPLVELLPKLPRERDRRWGHLLGPRPQQLDEPEADTAHERVSQSAPTSPLEQRVVRLEEEVAELRQIVDGLRGT